MMQNSKGYTQQVSLHPAPHLSFLGTTTTTNLGICVLPKVIWEHRALSYVICIAIDAYMHAYVHIYACEVPPKHS